MAKTGYARGKDMLLLVNGVAIGHCTSHKESYSTETKDVQVKPVATEGITNGMFKSKIVTGQAWSMTFEGLCFYDETEFGYKELFAVWKNHEDVVVQAMEREGADPYLEGPGILTSLEKDAPADDTASYSGTIEYNGEPTTLDETMLTENETTTE